MTNPQTPAVAVPRAAAAGTNPRRARPAGNAGSGPRLVSEASAGSAKGSAKGSARTTPAEADLPDIQYAVRYTAPEAFAGTVANIRHYRYTAEALCRSENDHPQHPDLRCHVVTRTVTYSPWIPIETEDC